MKHILSLFKSATPTITVIVHDGRWDAFAPVSVAPQAFQSTLKILQSLGGVSDSVPDGTYEFYAVREGLKTTGHLTHITAAQIL